MKTGDRVQFKEGLYSDEVGAMYEIVEINGDRAIIEFICDLPIPPQSVALISELDVVAEKSTTEDRQRVDKATVGCQIKSPPHMASFFL